jgi:adenylate kinase
MVDLSEVSAVELMKELQHRLDCTTKEEKRLILIGPPGCGEYTTEPLQNQT